VQNPCNQEASGVHAVDKVIEHREAQVGDVRLHWVEGGEGPLVVLLHGFPEFWYSWRNQIPALVEAGYRVVAPDMRGYARSGKPSGYDAYTADALVGDVAGLIAALGESSATVVGHDWGGVVAWLTAMKRPEVVDRLVIANCPHPAVYRRALRTPGQWLRSSYIGFFQVPVAPELVLRANDFAALRWTLRSASTTDGAFSDDDLDRYAAAFAVPGALEGALAYYRAMGRAMIRKAPETRTGRTIEAPTLVIWGRQDVVLGSTMADPGDRVPHRQVAFVEGAGHFVQADAPARFNELLLDFLAA
jgi:pimeloyl-ACP methyl ester carboxylesterase